MTYCVGMMLDRGLVLMSDTRTNSGVDNISTFRKMYHWELPGERIITIMTAGNLATTQAVVSQLEERNKAPSERHNSLLEAPTMFKVASIVGNLLQDIIEERATDNGQKAAAGTFSASMIVAGQIKGMEPRLFLIYPEGNFIEASFDTPFFQIGETKYGRPILIRGYERDMSFESAIKLMTVSFDSTLKANLSVGLPLDLLVLERDHFTPRHERRIDASDPYFAAVSTSWSEALRNALDGLPNYRMDPAVKEIVG
ncbi:proteasome-type protease [Novosphingobium sp. P6W]|uniref:proteasome-type protease n=1 Tax=Novosphingobium sp. P6W TaxID=1609758 RepID=UPI0005C2A645|nr:proteasome-type protease [Novosphingobium sp. P6W]AXB76112.1 peptidase [Novosphingobium sp. P6W]KIS31502.1 peptidase [Novosphingobium sp. P6W]